MNQLVEKVQRSLVAVAYISLVFMLFEFALPSYADVSVSGPSQSPADPILNPQTGSVDIDYTFTLTTTTAVPSLTLDILQDTAQAQVSASSSFTVISSTNSACSSDGSVFCSNLPVGATTLVLRITAQSTNQVSFTTSASCVNQDQSTCNVSSVNFLMQARLPQAGTFQFSQTAYMVKESAGTASIQVNRTGGADGVVTVAVATQASRASNAAVAGKDYTAVNQTLTFNAGETQQSFNVQILPNSVAEGQKELLLALSNPSAGATVGQTATLTISDLTGLTSASGLTSNQLAVAQALDIACSSASGALANRCLELSTLSNGDLKNALDQIAPGALFSEGAQAIQVSQIQMLNLRNRLNVVRTPGAGQEFGDLNLNYLGKKVPLGSIGKMLMKQGGSAGEENDTPWGVFANGKINVGKQDKENTLDPGFDFKGQNITFGVDYRRNEKIVLGGAMGYAKSNVDIGQNRGKVDIDAWYFSHYGNWYPFEALYVDWVASVGKANYDAERSIKYTGFSSIADSTTSGRQYSVSFSVGSDISKQAWQLGSYARLDWARSTIYSFSETGGDGLGLHVGDQEAKQNTFVLGGKASRSISWSRGVIIPGLFVEAAHEFQNDPRKVTSSFVAVSGTNFTVLTTKPDANYFNYGINLVSVFTQGRSAFFNMQGVAGLDGRTSYVFEAGGRFEF